MINKGNSKTSKTTKIKDLKNYPEDVYPGLKDVVFAFIVASSTTNIGIPPSDNLYTYEAFIGKITNLIDFYRNNIINISRISIYKS